MLNMADMYSFASFDVMNVYMYLKEFQKLVEWNQQQNLRNTIPKLFRLLKPTPTRHPLEQSCPQ